jgi:uncharacterized membrane-anchored protein
VTLHAQFKGGIVAGNFRFRSLTVCLMVLLGFATAAAARQDAGAELKALNWIEGPATAQLGNIAQIEVPEGFRFVGKPGAGKFMELIQNPSDGSELGILLSPDSWFVVFDFSSQGYIKDDDRKLDADAILSTIKEGTAASNKERRKRGWSELQVLGWHEAPHYDAETNNLTWSIRGSSDDGENINHSTRLLGRRGVMNVDLVMGPEQADAALGEFNEMLTGFEFKTGSKYSDFTRGDKVAEYGLAGLVVGGAGVALVKTGLLQKFAKLIIVGFVALAGAVKKLWAKLTGRGEAPAHG